MIYDLIAGNVGCAHCAAHLVMETRLEFIASKQLISFRIYLRAVLEAPIIIKGHLPVKQRQWHLPQHGPSTPDDNQFGHSSIKRGRDTPAWLDIEQS